MLEGEAMLILFFKYVSSKPLQGHLNPGSISPKGRWITWVDTPEGLIYHYKIIIGVNKQ